MTHSFFFSDKDSSDESDCSSDDIKYSTILENSIQRSLLQRMSSLNASFGALPGDPTGDFSPSELSEEEVSDKCSEYSASETNESVSDYSDDDFFQHTLNHTCYDLDIEGNDHDDCSSCNSDDSYTSVMDQPPDLSMR